MSKMGIGYGSEWHLLRYLGRHRGELDRAVLQTTGADSIDWLDSRFDPKGEFCDAEIKGLDFLPSDSPVREKWLHFWPQTGGVPNWDAVGRMGVNGQPEWLIVEAKAHEDELRSSCGAKEEGGLATIQEAFRWTKETLGVPQSADWLEPYYQYANRLATAAFLRESGTGVRLLFVYFTGDEAEGKRCPETAAEWQALVEKVHAHLGIAGNPEVARMTHEVFLPVCPC